MKKFWQFVTFMYAGVIGCSAIMFGIGHFFTKYSFVELIQMSWCSGELVMGLILTFVSSWILWETLIKKS